MDNKPSHKDFLEEYRAALHRQFDADVRGIAAKLAAELFPGVDAAVVIPALIPRVRKRCLGALPLRDQLFLTAGEPGKQPN